MYRPWAVTVGYGMYDVRAFLKHLQKNISPILAICDQVTMWVSYVSDTCCALTRNIVEGEIVLTSVDLLTLLTQSLNVCLVTGRLNSAPHGYPSLYLV